MTVFTMCKLPHPTQGACVRCFVNHEFTDGESVRDNRADWQIIADLCEPGEKKSEEERLLINADIPADAVPLFRFWIVTKSTKHGYVHSTDYERFDGCPVAISAEGMKILSLIKASAKKNMKKTIQNAAEGRKVKLV